jgi:hypothetical protein
VVCIDTNRAINGAILTYLLADSTLISTMGNSNIRVGGGIRSDLFPYLSYSIRSDVDKMAPVVMDGILEVHLWDKKDLTDRIQEMRGRMIKLLDHETFEISGGEAKGVRLFYDSDGIIPEEEEFYHHIVILFTLKYIRSEDLNV